MPDDFDPATIPQHGDQHRPEVRARQREFQEHFGDFRSQHVVRFWVGPAPQGEWIGVYFELENGETVRASIPGPMWQRFASDCMLAIMSAAELYEAAYSKPEGSG